MSRVISFRRLSDGVIGAATILARLREEEEELAMWIVKGDVR